MYNINNMCRTFNIDGGIVYTNRIPDRAKIIITNAVFNPLRVRLRFEICEELIIENCIFDNLEIDGLNITNVSVQHNEIYSCDKKHYIDVVGPNIKYMRADGNLDMYVCLNYMPKLVLLNMSCTNTFFIDLQKLPDLRELNINDTNIAQTEFVHDKLEILTCNIPNRKSDIYLGGLPNLKKIWYYGCMSKCNKIIIDNPNLTDLDVSGRTVLCNHTYNLERIKVSHIEQDCSDINVDSIYTMCAPYHHMYPLNDYTSLIDLRTSIHNECNISRNTLILKNKTLLKLTLIYTRGAQKNTHVDVSGLTQLKYLDIFAHRRISHLNIGALSNLRTLIVNNMAVSALDLRKLSALKCFTANKCNIETLYLPPRLDKLTISIGNISNISKLINSAATTFGSLRQLTITHPVSRNINFNAAAPNLTDICLTKFNMGNVSIGAKSNLKKICMQHCNITNFDYDNIPPLTLLDLQDNNISTHNIPRNAKIKSLKISYDDKTILKIHEGAQIDELCIKLAIDCHATINVANNNVARLDICGAGYVKNITLDKLPNLRHLQINYTDMLDTLIIHHATLSRLYIVGYIGRPRALHLNLPNIELLQLNIASLDCINYIPKLPQRFHWQNSNNLVTADIIPEYMDIAIFMWMNQIYDVLRGADVGVAGTYVPQVIMDLICEYSIHPIFIARHPPHKYITQ